MKDYYRVMLGKGSKFATEGVREGFIGVDFGVYQDFKEQFGETLREFNRMFIPRFLAARPKKSKVAAGLGGGAVWMIGQGLHTGDIVLSPDGSGHYCVGEISGDYYFQPDGVLPHRRPVRWYADTIDRSAMSEALRLSTGSAGTAVDLTPYREELEALIAQPPVAPIQALDEDIEDPYAFAMEKHLEAFIIRNWARTAFGREYNIYEDEGELVGNQFPTDTGPIDILAISKDKQTLLVIELKRGRASDVVVGQILRYMGYVQEELAESGQRVKGAIVALEDDVRIRHALKVAGNIEFYRYQVSFKLLRV